MGFLDSECSVDSEFSAQRSRKSQRNEEKFVMDTLDRTQESQKSQKSKPTSSPEFRIDKKVSDETSVKSKEKTKSKFVLLSSYSRRVKYKS